MRNERLERREFHKLTLAALGGALTGSLAGCDKGPAPATTGKGTSSASSSTTGGVTVASADTKSELHLCHGLNSCKNQGAGGKNDCAGTGACATVKHHECGSDNECKNLGGCGGKEGANECKGKGGCHVPLMEGARQTVRDRLETKMKNEGKTLGKDPGLKKS